MGKTNTLGLAIGVLAGITLTGCQSTDSGSGSRLMAKQSNSTLGQPVTGYPYNPSGNKGLGIPNTANGSTSMSAANGLQQASAMQNNSVPSAGGGSISPTGTGSNFDQGGQVVSRQMGSSPNVAPSSGPVPPTTPGSYALPSPSTYTPPPSSEVPVRKPGDDQ